MARLRKKSELTRQDSCQDGSKGTLAYFFLAGFLAAFLAGFAAFLAGFLALAAVAFFMAMIFSCPSLGPSDHSGPTLRRGAPLPPCKAESSRTLLEGGESGAPFAPYPLPSAAAAGRAAVQALVATAVAYHDRAAVVTTRSVLLIEERDSGLLGAGRHGRGRIRGR